MAKLKKVESNAKNGVEENVVDENVLYLNEDGETERLPMLAGYLDEEGTLHTSFTLREMTGKDEEAVAKADVRSNGSKVISVLLERCVTSIGTLTRKSVGTEKWREVIRNLYTGDQDYMLIKLRALSVSEELEVAHDCPQCKQGLKTFIDLDELEVVPFKEQREIPFELIRGYRDKHGEVHKHGTMSLPKGVDREILTPLAKKNLAVANTLMLTRLCKIDDLVVTEDVMRDLTSRDREYLQKLLQEHYFGLNLQIEVTCTSCGETFEGNLNATNFM